MMEKYQGLFARRKIKNFLRKVNRYSMDINFLEKTILPYRLSWITTMLFNTKKFTQFTINGKLVFIIDFFNVEDMAIAGLIKEIIYIKNIIKQEIKKNFFYKNVPMDYILGIKVEKKKFLLIV